MLLVMIGEKKTSVNHTNTHAVLCMIHMYHTMWYTSTVSEFSSSFFQLLRILSKNFLLSLNENKALFFCPLLYVFVILLGEQRYFLLLLRMTLYEVKWVGKEAIYFYTADL